MQTAITYQDLINQATQQLYKSSDSPRIDAEVLIQHVTQQPLAWLIVHGNTNASSPHIKHFYQLLEQREQGEPIAYLTGHKEFWSLDLKVTEAVLIPRPDTETLVEQALERLDLSHANKVLDLGTGSGAIALSIAKECPQSDVLAVDYSQDALDIAKQNARKHDLHNLTFLCSDWFQNIKDTNFDLIASNPPYIEENDPHLQQGGLRYEPQSALVSADLGLSDIRCIITQSPNHLKSGGHLLIEHGYKQADEVRAFFKEAGFTQIQNYRDLNDLPRCTAGIWLADS